MALAKARYGFLTRSAAGVAVGSPAESAGTRAADAPVVFAMPAYFGLAMKVMCPREACSIPTTPVISIFAWSGERESRRAPSASASCCKVRELDMGGFYRKAVSSFWFGEQFLVSSF